MNQTNEKICLRCYSPKMKNWDELNDEERMLAEKLPVSAEFTPKERKKHRFCVKCWYEQFPNGEVV